MGGFRPMLAIAWRGSRRQVLWWVAGLIAVFLGTAWSLHNLYPTPEKLATYARVAESDTTLYAINGRPYGLGSIGGVIVYEFGFIAALAFPLMGVHLVNRMTRREEQSNRMDVLRAGRIGRAAPVAAALTILALALVVVAAAMGAALVGLGLGWPGVGLYPLSVALLGLCFGALTALAAQVFANPRLVTATGLAVLAVSVLSRGVGDVRDSWVRWLSPVGWAEQTRPFATARWSAAALAAASVAVLTIAAVAVSGRRDLGAGLFAARLGPERAGSHVLGPLGFAVRQHRASVLAWSIVAALIGGTFGSVTDTFSTAMAENQSLADAFGGGSAAAYGSYTVVLLVLVCSGFGLQAMGRAAEAEDDSRLEAVLAGDVSRPRWLASQALAIAGGSVVVLAVGALSLGVSDGVAAADATAPVRYLGAAAAYVPTVLSVVAFAILLYGARPARLPASWLVFVLIAVIATLGDTLKLPGWALDISPLTWVGRTPLDPVNGWAVTGSTLLAGALTVVGLLLFRRRDIGTGQPQRVWTRVFGGPASATIGVT